MLAVQQGKMKCLELFYEQLLEMRPKTEIRELFDSYCVMGWHRFTEWNPLHLAAFWGHPDIVTYLVDVVGVDKLKTNVHNETALDIARRRGYQNIVSFLSE